MEVIGFILMPVGLALAVYSFYRYFQKQRLIQRQRQEFAQTSHHHADLHEKESPRYGNTD